MAIVVQELYGWVRGLLQSVRQAISSLLYGPPELEPEAAGQLRSQQISAVTRLTMFMMAANGATSLIVLAMFWESPFQPFVLGWAVVFIGLSLLIVKQWLGNRHKPVRSSTSPRAIARLARNVSVPAIFWAALPVVLFSSSSAHQQLLISSIVTGSLCVGLFGLSSVPLAALSYASVIVLGAVIGMAMTGNPDFIGVTVLLFVYVACALGSVAWFSSLFVSRFRHGLELERQGDLINMLLHDFEQHASDWLWESTTDGRLTVGSMRFAEQLKREPSELADRPMMKVLAEGLPRDCPEQRELRKLLFERKAFAAVEIPVVIAEEMRWWSVTGKPIYSKAGLYTGYRGVVSDVTEVRRNADVVKHMAHHDALTGLPNRSTFAAHIGSAIEDLSRGSRGFSLMLIDLDNFKSINDTLGHAAGDDLLVETTKRLVEVLPADCLVARLGGDEFAAIYPEGAGEGSVDTLAHRVISALTDPFNSAGLAMTLGCSIGIAAAPRDGNSAEDLLRRADLALYRAKHDGRGCARHFEPSIEAVVQQRMQMEESLRKATLDDQLSVHYQPIVDLATGRVCGAEALLRWNDPVLGSVSPVRFIPIAEETGVITAIGEWVLKRACTDAAQWPSHMTVSVNLSPAQFKSVRLQAAVVHALDFSGLSPHRLELEITESVLLAEGSALQVIEQLKILGLSLALDDFGTGYSSLSYLRQFPFDKIKIDRSFVREAVHSLDCKAIVETVADLGQKLGMRTTAEGIETAMEKELVVNAGCSFGQGYLFGKPMALKQFRQLLAVQDQSRAAA
jgi:diguanylate cyclase (GGDEF)-like protein